MQMKTLVISAGLALATALAGCSSDGAVRLFSNDYGARSDAGYSLPAIPIYKVDRKYHRQVVRYPSDEKPGTIIVDTGEKHLYLIMEDGKATVRPRTLRAADLAGILGPSPVGPVTIEEMNEAIAEAAVERFKRAVKS